MKTKKVKTPPLRLVYAEAGSLEANPRNWRTHPPEQMKALRATMNKVGWAGAILFNERTGRILDGHARQKDAIEQAGAAAVVPVLVGSWSEEDEKFILATHDPLAAMALPDDAQLRELLGEVKLDALVFAPMLEDLDKELAALVAPPQTGDSPDAKSPGKKGADAADDEAPDEDGDSEEQTAGQKGGEKLASSFQVVAVCEDENQQQRIYELVKAAGVKCRLNTLH